MRQIKQPLLVISGILSFVFLMIFMTGEIAFTEGNLDHGREVYSNNCLSCHGKDGKDGFAPALHNVLEKYPSEEELLSYVSKNMPKGMAGALSNDEYVAVVAYIVSLNKIDEEPKAETKEEPKEETEEEPKVEPKEETTEETKEETTEETKEETTEETKEETTEEPKEEPKVETKEETTEEPKEESKAEAKVENKEEPKAESNEEAKEETEKESEEPANEELTESIEVVAAPYETENKRNTMYLWIVLFLAVAIGSGIFLRQKLKRRKN